MDEKTTLFVHLQSCRSPDSHQWKKTLGRVRVTVYGDLPPPAPSFPALRAGDVIRFRANFRPPTNFKNPGSFDWVRHLRTQGITAVGSISKPETIEVVRRDDEGMGAWLENFRERLRQAAGQAEAKDSGGFLLSLLIGERHGMSPAVLENFRNAGVAHIIAISGLNVTMVALIFLFLCRLFVALPGFSRSILFLRLAPCLAAVPLWLYVAAAGMPVSAVRAAIMASAVLAALAVWRRLDLLSSWALAAILILCASPLALWSASFQLSFIAVLFLMLFFPRWQKFRAAWRKPFSWLADSFAISLISIAAVAPILFFHFHELSIVGLIANVVVVPMTNILLLPLGIAGWLFTGLCGLDVAWIWKAASFFSDATLRVVAFFARHSDWGIFHGAVSFWELVLYYGICFLWRIPARAEFPGVAPRPRRSQDRGLGWRFGKKWKLGLSAAMMLMMLAGGGKTVDGKLRVTFLDVGQGDSAVVELPNGKVWVIDGGGIKGSDWDIGRFVVAPALWEMGIHRIDKLFLSHPHHDHYKGLGFLARQFSPAEIYANGDDAPEGEVGEWREFLAKVKEKKIPIRKVTSAAPPLEESGVRLEFFMPQPSGTFPHFDTNDNSIVMRLTFGETSFLFPGDLMEAGEITLLESKPLPKSTVLKVGHHGSQTSTNPAFLGAVSPQYAVISVGPYNAYGMPDESVLRRLEQSGVMLTRTDRNGAITFETDGKAVSVKTFVPIP